MLFTIKNLFTPHYTQSINRPFHQKGLAIAYALCQYHILVMETALLVRALLDILLQNCLSNCSEMAAA